LQPTGGLSRRHGPRAAAPAGEDWFRQYAAGIPDFPAEVRDFNVSGFLTGLGYTMGKKVAIDLFWLPPGYDPATGRVKPAV
jgi:hypothetical protein